MVPILRLEKSIKYSRNIRLLIHIVNLGCGELTAETGWAFRSAGYRGFGPLSAAIFRRAVAVAGGAPVEGEGAIRMVHGWLTRFRTAAIGGRCLRSGVLRLGLAGGPGFCFRGRRATF